MIGFAHKATFFGPNPYSQEPVVVVDVTVPDEIAARSEAIEARIAAMHGWWLGDQSLDRPVGGAARIARLLLHWAFAALNRERGFLQALGWNVLDEGRFRLWTGFHQPRLSVLALNHAADLIAEAAEDRADAEEWEAKLGRFWETCRFGHPDYQARRLMEAARAADIPFMPAWGKRAHWQFGWGAKSRVMVETASQEEGYLAGRIVAAKDESKELLISLGLPTPDYVLLRNEEDIPAAVERIGFPCVTKPLRLFGGKGIATGLTSLDEVRSGFAYARSFSQGPVMIEGFVEGADHRIMVIDGSFAGAFRRHPPAVIGDGSSTIRQLVEHENAKRAKLRICDDGYLDPIRFDDAADQFLAGMKMSPDTVLKEGELAVVRGNANLSTGGFATDVTATMHPDIGLAAEVAARTLNLRVAGFDYLSTDISRNWEEGDGAFIEMNLTPGIDIMTEAGRPNFETAMAILGDKPGRIALDAIVVPDELLPDVEAYIARLAGADTCGWASHDKARLGRLSLQVRMRHPWAGVMTLLGHRVLESAWLIVAGSKLQRIGFPVDRADRIWVCGGDVPDPWMEALRASSRNPVWHGQWEEFLRLGNENAPSA